VLLSGDHARIAAWRREQALLRTARLRPDLLDAADLTDREREIVAAATTGTDDKEDD
jgi:tRNA (guanine37-N1)-methyltransferase